MPDPQKLLSEPLAEYLLRQQDWSRRTFGEEKRTGGICKHIRKELDEIVEDPSDYREWIDVVILGLDGFWRHGGSIEEVQKLLQEKQDKNFAREWPKPASEDEAVEHVGGANHRIRDLERQLAEKTAEVQRSHDKVAHAKTNLCQQLYHALVPIIERELKLDPCPAVHVANRICNECSKAIYEDELSSIVIQENEKSKAKAQQYREALECIDEECNRLNGVSGGEIQMIAREALEQSK